MQNDLPQSPQEKKSKLNLFLLIIVIVLIITNIGTVFYFFNKQKQNLARTQNKISKIQKDNNSKTQKRNSSITAKKKDIQNKKKQSITATGTIAIATNTKPQIATNTSSILDSTSTITVLWNKELLPVDVYELFDKHPEEKNYIKDYIKSLKVYEAGIVSNGQYKNKKLYLVRYDVMGIVEANQMMRVIKDVRQLIVLQKYNSATLINDAKNILKDEDAMWGYYWGKNFQKFKINNDIVISNLQSPKTIKIPNSSLTLVRIEKLANEIIDFSKTQKLFKYNNENFVYFKKDDGCFLLKSQDGTAVRYTLSLNFVDKDYEPAQYSGLSPNMLKITWNNGEKNKNEYSVKDLGSCGHRGGCLNYANYITDKSQLKIVGKTENGDPIYELADKNFIADCENKENCKSVLQEIYDMKYPIKSDNDKSYEEFLASHPLIFWQDPFGNFVEFKNAFYMPVVECGKPVIYLYPEQESNVYVQVWPNGGFSKTEPSYKNGWFVKASPDGKLYNYDDKKTYPYLFWEGRGINYNRPQKGFVVKQENLKKFLEEKLAKLGLIPKEYNEFIDYWQEKMKDSPYYLINFVPKEEFDKIAPLNIEPKPDTIIRVFMDYQKLDKPIPVEEPKLITPQRKGFTVVEWGGALNR